MYNDFESTAYQKAGDYNLSAFINLIPYNYDSDGSDIKRLDIFNIVQEINIFESLNSDVITGNMVVVDATNTFGDVPIAGFERLEFKITTPGLSRVYDFSVKTGNPVFVYKVSNREELNQSTQAYVLEFCSIERIKNESRLFSKSYHDSHEAIVRDILRNQLKSKKTFIFEPSKSLHKHVFPFVKPFSAIDYLADDTQSRAHNGAGYKFYETSTGFHFRSYESMTNTISGVPRPVVASYSLKRKGVRGGGDRNLVSDLQSINSFRIVRQSDTIENFDLGVYASEMFTHNQFTKEFNTKTFNYLNNRAFVSQMETDNRGQVQIGQGIVPNMRFEDNKTPADMIGRRFFKSNTSKLHNNATTPPKESIEQKRISKDGALRTYVLEITIPGFFGINAGDVVDVEIPAYDNKNAGAVDPISGRFLVHECRHLINKGKAVHTTHLRLHKDSFKRILDDETFDTFTEQRSAKDDNDYSIADLDAGL